MNYQRIYRDMEEVRRRLDRWESTCIHSLERCKYTARDIAHYIGKIKELETLNGKLEQTYLHTKAVNGNKREQWLVNAESLSSTKSTIEDLKKMKQELSARRCEREMIISDQLTGDSDKPDVGFKRGQKEAVAWYNRALGFRIESGHGIKFIFVNVDQICPDREFSFSIRHCRSNDCYSCTEELLDELNRTNDLFKFVRVMRGKFQEHSSKGYKQPASNIKA
ncbi:kinetochore protein SPC25 homolog isoform X2 [Cryptomeria japonica]|uniref:kinetochore protein SPC25 homolog isoform X2 n=2 Tax=Cryptomeria japonica TaxID=3369 RepID=UPI0027DA72EB|nr:kinetochore protein SPC25 homolog isoform X2 [Cryptomeria japonica]